MVQEEIVIGVLQMSDRASADVNAYNGLSGEAIIKVMNEYISSPFKPIFKIIPDEYEFILDAFKQQKEMLPSKLQRRFVKKFSPDLVN
jgi:molybdopterin adenylyltransferase